MDSPHEVVAVLTQPDRPSGRGRKSMPGPIKKMATDAGLTVSQPQTLKNADVQAELVAFKPDLMVVVAYGLLLPPEVLAIPARGCINIHASLLPRWRGASPVQAAIMAGDDETGVSIMQMGEGLDTGAVLSKRSIAINAHETASQLHDRLSALGGEMLAGSLDDLLAGKLQAVPQAEEGVTFAGRISKQDGAINWTRSAVEIDRQIRAYNSWPVAHTSFNGELLRCWAADVESGEAGAGLPPGSLLGLNADGLRVQSGDGVLVLRQLQLAGGKQILAADFANAHAIDAVVLGQ
jgi:methionyl-tRNA formyltransferase